MMFDSQNPIKLILFLGIAVGAVLLYILYLIVFSPNGLVGNP